MNREWHAWAIRIKDSAGPFTPEREFLAGRFMWLEGRPPPKAPPHFEGCLLMLFGTREDARKASASLRYSRDRAEGGKSRRCASPVRVTVSVSCEMEET